MSARKLEIVFAPPMFDFRAVKVNVRRRKGESDARLMARVEQQLRDAADRLKGAPQRNLCR